MKANGFRRLKNKETRTFWLYLVFNNCCLFLVYGSWAGKFSEKKKKKGLEFESCKNLDLLFLKIYHCIRVWVAAIESKQNSNKRITFIKWVYASNKTALII